MKIAATIIFTFLFTTVYGQFDDHQIVLDSAKTLFKQVSELPRQERDKFDYSQIISLLERSIVLNPENTEARYFLAYTYSRMNSGSGHGIISMNIDLVYKFSEQMEKVIALTPKYSGELLLLDPYSKITAEWGSLAMSYWQSNQKDSAVWAFQEGKKRGGFGDYVLTLNKSFLDACNENSILFASGDIISIPLWYLQIVESYRTDVSVVDASLLNTVWYPKYLASKNSVSFDLESEVLDTISHTYWIDSTITINNFTWVLKPSYYEQYLTRGDRVMLSILKENEFQRDLFFTLGFDKASQLSLNTYLSSYLLVNKFTALEPFEFTFEDYKSTISKVFSLSKKINVNSQDEISLLDLFRFDVLSEVDYYQKSGEKKKAKELLEIVDKMASNKRYPFQNEYLRDYSKYLRKKNKS
jgi:hypothetical protein